jgi:hypothetical protein
MREDHREEEISNSALGIEYKILDKTKRPEQVIKKKKRGGQAPGGQIRRTGCKEHMAAVKKFVSPMFLYLKVKRYRLKNITPMIIILKQARSYLLGKPYHGEIRLKPLANFFRQGSF